MGLAGAYLARLDAVFPVGYHRHRGHRSASAEDTRHGVSRVSENNKHIRAVVSQTCLKQFEVVISKSLQATRRSRTSKAAANPQNSAYLGLNSKSDHRMSSTSS